MSSTSAQHRYRSSMGRGTSLGNDQAWRLGHLPGWWEMENECSAHLQPVGTPLVRAKLKAVNPKLKGAQDACLSLAFLTGYFRHVPTSHLCFEMSHFSI